MSEACVRRVVSGVLLSLLIATLVGCRGMSSSNGGNNNGGTTSSPANPTANLTVSPNSIEQNGTVTLSWTTSNATSVTLSQNGVSVPLDGNPLNMPALQIQVNTVGTTTFKLTATGAAGTTAAVSSAAVNVTPPPPPPVAATLTATPTTVQVGSAVVLTWTTTNAKHAVLTQDGVDLHINQLNGSMQVTLNNVGTVVFQLTADDGLGHQVTVQASVQVTPIGNTGDITAVQHIIFIAQENRSFDVYFGKLNEYRVANGWGGPNDVDGLDDSCSSTNSDWTVPCKNMNKSPDDHGVPKTPVYAFHLKSMCIENTSADWIVSHWAYNAEDPNSDTPLMDGFVIGAASAAPPDGDKAGIRAMGFYTAADLPYHYWLASEFGTSDRWFAPAPARTEPNRFYLVGGTSAGFAYPKVHPEGQINADTIFDRLEAAGVSWKIYSNQNLTTSAAAFRNFMQKYGPGSPEPHVFTLDQFYTDLHNGTLPAVAYIDKQDRDEHPGLGDHIQYGVLQTKEILDALMASSAWKTSVFIMTFDEAGGLYDHVPPPIPVVSPDGIAPFDTCFNANDPHCPTAALTHTPPPYDPTGDFTRYGFRVPTVIVSPFSKPHYVSHTPTDSTSWLAFVEKRFKIQPLTARDAAADNLLEFFDFKTVPWLVPPTPPHQPTNGPCYDGLP